MAQHGEQVEVEAVHGVGGALQAATAVLSVKHHKEQDC